VRQRACEQREVGSALLEESRRCPTRTCTHCSASASELVLNTRFLSQKMHQQVPPTRCRVVRGVLAWIMDT
jgi:hypothetical protein